MKKSIAIITAAILALSLCACSNGGSSSSKSESTVESKTESKVESKVESKIESKVESSATEFDYTGTWEKDSFELWMDTYVDIYDLTEVTLELKNDGAFKLYQAVKYSGSDAGSTLTGTYTASGSKVTFSALDVQVDGMEKIPFDSPEKFEGELSADNKLKLSFTREFSQVFKTITVKKTA